MIFRQKGEKKELGENSLSPEAKTAKFSSYFQSAAKPTAHLQRRFRSYKSAASQPRDLGRGQNSNVDHYLTGFRFGQIERGPVGLRGGGGVVLRYQ